MDEFIKLRLEALAKAKVITDRVKAEGRDLNEDEQTEIVKLAAEAKALGGKIEAVKAAQSAQDELARIEVEASKPQAARSIGEVPVIESFKENLNDDLKRGFANMGEYAIAVQAACTPGQVADNRLRIMASDGMNQNTGSEGGFLVPPQFSTNIWDGLNAEPDNMLARTDQFTIEGESIQFPANAETSRKNGSRYGGVQGFWIAEGAEITKSKPTVRGMRLEPQQLAVLVKVTEKLLRNTPVALEQYINRASSDEINFLVSNAIVDGTGSGQPKGLLRADGTIVVAKETGQVEDTIVTKNIDKMWGRLHPRARANAIWYYNVDIEEQLAGLERSVGTGGELVMNPAGGLSAAPFNTIKGRPAMPLEYCKTLGDQGDIFVGDMKFYATGIRGGIEAASSMHLFFDTANMAFRFMFEVDGRPWLESAITPFNGTTTLAPFVTLAERA